MKPVTELSENNRAWVIYQVDRLPANASLLDAMRLIWSQLDRFDIDRPLMRGIIKAASERLQANINFEKGYKI